MPYTIDTLHQAPNGTMISHGSCEIRKRTRTVMVRTRRGNRTERPMAPRFDVYDADGVCQFSTWSAKSAARRIDRMTAPTVS